MAEHEVAPSVTSPTPPEEKDSLEQQPSTDLPPVFDPLDPKADDNSSDTDPGADPVMPEKKDTVHIHKHKHISKTKAKKGEADALVTKTVINPDGTKQIATESIDSKATTRTHRVRFNFRRRIRKPGQTGSDGELSDGAYKPAPLLPQPTGKRGRTRSSTIMRGGNAGARGGPPGFFDDSPPAKKGEENKRPPGVPLPRGSRPPLPPEDLMPKKTKKPEEPEPEAVPEPIPEHHSDGDEEIKKEKKKHHRHRSMSLREEVVDQSGGEKKKKKKHHHHNQSDSLETAVKKDKKKHRHHSMALTSVSHEILAEEDRKSRKALEIVPTVEIEKKDEEKPAPEPTEIEEKPKPLSIETQPHHESPQVEQQKEETVDKDAIKEIIQLTVKEMLEQQTPITSTETIAPIKDDEKTKVEQLPQEPLTIQRSKEDLTKDENQLKIIFDEEDDDAFAQPALSPKKVVQKKPPPSLPLSVPTISPEIIKDARDIPDVKKVSKKNYKEKPRRSIKEIEKDKEAKLDEGMTISEIGRQQRKKRQGILVKKQSAELEKMDSSSSDAMKELNHNDAEIIAKGQFMPVEDHLWN